MPLRQRHFPDFNLYRGARPVHADEARLRRRRTVKLVQPIAGRRAALADKTSPMPDQLRMEREAAQVGPGAANNLPPLAMQVSRADRARSRMVCALHITR